MNKQNKARVETIMMNAHTEGNGIKTALIPVDLCELSPIYQRDQGRHVAHIASNWDDNKAGHLEASERGDHFNIWDGGNRLRAAVMVGKTHVLCNIRTGLTDEDEAHLFVTQEENVTKLTQYDKFIAACASGEERGKVALLLRDICDEYVTKEDIEKEYGAFNKKNLETAMSVLRGEVDIYNQYIHGDVYWYRLEKFLGGTVAGEEVSPQEALYADIFWEEIDSCGGFYGSDVTENGMTEHWPEMEEVA